MFDSPIKMSSFLYQVINFLLSDFTVPVNIAAAPGGVAKRDPPVGAQCCVHAAPVCHTL